MTRSLAFLLLFIVSSAAIAQSEDDQSTEEMLAQLKDMFITNKEATDYIVNTLSRCAGVYDVVATLQEAEGKPANAENARGFARGARSAAMYLLGQEHIYTGGEPKPYGEFAPYVDSIREIGAVRFMALVEDADTTAIEKEMIECVGINEMQTALVQMMRDEMAGR